MRRWRACLPSAVLLCEVLLFYRKVLFSSHWGIPWDLRSYHLPQVTFLADSLGRGELPLWDPYTYCGFPIYASIPAQAFYPPAWITILASNLKGGEHLVDYLEWQIALHVFVAGVFAYWLLRRLGVSKMAALVAATIFQLGGYFASQTQHLGAMNGAAWLPLAWLAVVSLGRGFSWRWVAVLSAAMAMSVLAGFPAVSFVVLGSTFLLALTLAALRQAPLRLVGHVCLAAAWSALLAAALILPAMELTGLSVAKYRGDWLGTGGGLPLASLVSLVIPNYYGIFDLSGYSSPWNPTFLYVYCGIPGLALVLVSFFHWRWKPVRPFLVLLVVTLLWMLGDSTPVGRWLLPRLSRAFLPAVYPESAMAAFNLAVAVMAGLAAHRLLNSRRTLLGAALVAVTAADLILTGSARPMNTCSLDRDPGLTRTHLDGNREVLDRSRALVAASTPPARIDTVNDSMAWAMGAPLTGVPTANGNDPLALTRLMQVRLLFTGGERWGRYYQVSRPDSAILPLLNVRFLLSRTPVVSASYRKVAELPGRAVYENPRALPRFFLVERVVHAVGMEEALAVLRSSGFDPRTTAVVEGDAKPGPADGDGSVRVLQYSPRRVALEVESAKEAFLATSEVHYPGWRAWIDGREQAIALTDVAFRGLWLPGGRHVVEMRFEPGLLWLALGLSALGWVLMAWRVWA